MKTWLNNLILLLFCSILFLSCKERIPVFQGTASELMNMYLEKKDLDYKQKSFIEVDGKIAWIEYPKDGNNLNVCSISVIAGDYYDKKKREGNIITCIMKDRYEKELVGNYVKVKGELKSYTSFDNYSVIFLEKCLIE